MTLFTFFVFEWKCPFWANLIQKIKIVTFCWNLVPRLIRLCKTHWCYSLFCFWVEIPFLGKFGPKHQNCHFKLKFGTYTSSNMQNSMMIFIYLFFFDRKYPFWANLVQKVNSISWNWNLGPRLIQIWRIQWWCSFFLFLIGSTLFGQILSKKSKLSVEAKIW